MLSRAAGGYSVPFSFASSVISSTSLTSKFDVSIVTRQEVCVRLFPQIHQRLEVPGWAVVNR